MSVALIFAACLSTSAVAAATQAPPPANAPIDRSLSDQGRLTELQIDVRSAYEKGEIDEATATRLYAGIARVRRQLIIMGLQVGYRQRVRVRGRIDALYARLAASRVRAPADIRSEK